MPEPRGRKVKTRTHASKREVNPIMSASIGQSIEALCKEHGIDRDLVVEAMKEAVRAAARKQFKSGEEIQVEFSTDTGLEIFATKEVVEAVENPGKELSLDEA